MTLNPSKKPNINIQMVVSRPFMENTYIVSLPGRNDCIIVDPGMETNEITQYINEKRLTPAVILNTHGHADHIAGNEAMKRCWPDCPLVIGHGDVPKLSDPVANLSAKYGFSLISPPADALVKENDIYTAAGMELLVRETPGHSCGHVVFIWKESNPWIVFGGDVLFQGSVGRTDLPDGSFEDLMASIHQKLFPLPDDTIVLSGHGDPTTIGEEKRSNPFVGVASGRFNA